VVVFPTAWEERFGEVFVYRRLRDVADNVCPQFSICAKHRARRWKRTLSPTAEQAAAGATKPSACRKDERAGIYFHAAGRDG